MANHAAQGTNLTAISKEVSQCLAALKTIGCRHYAERFDAQLAVSSNDREHFSTTPRLSRSIACINDLTTKDVALVAPFLWISTLRINICFASTLQTILVVVVVMLHLMIRTIGCFGAHASSYSWKALIRVG